MRYEHKMNYNLIFSYEQWVLPAWLLVRWPIFCSLAFIKPPYIVGISYRTRCEYGLNYNLVSQQQQQLFFLFVFFILRRMGKNKALAHHTSTYFHTRRVSI